MSGELIGLGVIVAAFVYGGRALFRLFPSSGAMKREVQEPQPTELQAGAELAVKLFEDFRGDFELIDSPSKATTYYHDIGVHVSIAPNFQCAVAVNGALLDLTEPQKRRIRIVDRELQERPKVDAVMTLARRVRSGDLLQ